MKARDSVTGTFKEVYVKALDSLPVGSEIDFDGNTSDIPAGWEEASGKSYKAYELYNNTSGTNATFTLTDSLENYNYMEVYFRNSDNIHNSVKIENPNSKTFTTACWYVSSNGNNIKATKWTGSTNTITRVASFEAAIGGSPNYSTNSVYVYKVIGYKEV